METESLLFSIIIIILLALNTYLIYKNKKDFSCPTCNCPKCDAPTICDIPSNQAFVNYLRSNLITPLIELSEDQISNFLNENVVFSDKNTMLFAIDYEKVYSAFKGSLLDNQYKINETNLRYLYATDDNDKDKFLNTYRLSEFPTPLLTFANTGLYFGYLSSAQSWKMFVDNNVLLKKGQS